MSSMLNAVLQDANEVLGSLIEDQNIGKEEYLHRLGALTERLRDLERYGDVELTVKGRLS